MKEVNTKEEPEAKMTQEKVIDFQDLDDAFVLAQAEKYAVDKLIQDLHTG